MPRWVKSKGTTRTIVWQQAASPTEATGLAVGDIWIDISSTPVVKVCTNAATPTFNTVLVTDAELSALAELVSAANKIPMFSGSGTATLIDFKDEDDMSSNSATAVPSQQSVKAYVDANAGGSGSGSTISTLFFECIGTIDNQIASSTSGSGASVAATTDVENGTIYGVYKNATGTTTTGYARLRLGGSSSNTGRLYLGSGVLTAEFNVCLSAVSDATDTYVVLVGIMDADVNADPTDGVYFKYTHSNNSGNWEGKTSASSSRTTLNCATAPTIVPSFQRLKIVVNATRTSVEFFLDDVSQGTIGTNIPGASTALGLSCFIIKSAGTNDRNLYTDYVKLDKEFSTAR